MELLHPVMPCAIGVGVYSLSFHHSQITYKSSKAINPWLKAVHLLQREPSRANACSIAEHVVICRKCNLLISNFTTVGCAQIPPTPSAEYWLFLFSLEKKPYRLLNHWGTQNGKSRPLNLFHVIGGGGFKTKLFSGPALLLFFLASGTILSLMLLYLFLALYGAWYPLMTTRGKFVASDEYRTGISRFPSQFSIHSATNTIPHIATSRQREYDH